MTGVPSSLPTEWSLRSGYLIGPGANLRGGDLRGGDLAGAILTGATLTGVRSGGVTGVPSSLPNEWSLRSGYLIGPGADLTNADLAVSDLRSLNFSGSTLLGAHLQGSKLTGATLKGVSSGGVMGVPDSLPDAWTLIGGYLVGPGADLTNARLTRKNLTGVKLADATLTGVRSGGVIGIPASLPARWALRAGYLLGPKANLTGATLTGKDLHGVYLRGANLNRAVITGANVTGARLVNASTAGLVSGKLVGKPASLPDRSAIRNGYLVAPGVVLKNADLHGLNLTSLNLAGVTLTGTKLAGANLAGVASGGLAGKPTSLPSGWKLINGYLIGPKADLTNANLANANLLGANLSGATTTGTIWTGATCPDGAGAARHVDGSCTAALIP